MEPKYVPQLFLGSLLETRWSAIGQFFPLSLQVVTVPEIFVEVYSVQFPSRFNSSNSNLLWIWLIGWRAHGHCCQFFTAVVFIVCVICDILQILHVRSTRRNNTIRRNRMQCSGLICYFLLETSHFLNAKCHYKFRKKPSANKIYMCHAITKLFQSQSLWHAHLLFS